MKHVPVARSDDEIKRSFARNGELGQSFYSFPTVTLLTNGAKFEMANGDHGYRVFGFHRTETARDSGVERRLQLARVKIEDGDIRAHYLAAGPHQVGQVVAVRGLGNEIQITEVTDFNWDGLKRRTFPQAGGPSFAVGQYTLSVDASQAADVARRAEEEHEDDFERAFNLTYSVIETVVERQAQRVVTFRASSSTVHYDSGQLDAQEVANKRMLVQAVITDLRHQQPALVPADIGMITGLDELIQAMEGHWSKCLGALRMLSLLRDYNRSHSATSEIVVERLPSSVATAAVGASSGPAWNVNPLIRQQPSGPNWTTNPLLGGASTTGSRRQPGSMTLRVRGPATLLGNTERLIRFDNPFFREGYTMDLARRTPGVLDFRW